MTPRFDPDFESAHAFIPVYKDGNYRVKVGSPTPFVSDKRDGDGKVAGVRYTCYMQGKFDQKGKLHPIDEGQVIQQPAFFVHTQGSFGMTKQFLMAVAGYGRDDEDKANKEFFAPNKGEFFVEQDPEDETKAICGKGWSLIQDKYVDVYLKEGSYQPKDDQGNPVGEAREQQEFGSWTPAK